MAIQLEVIGRHAMLFDDDDALEFINSKEALIEWNNSLFIDRFDVRHLITTVPSSFRNLPSDYHRTGLPEDDSHLFPDLDIERFGDLISVDLHHEAEEEVNNAGGYRCVPFSYGNPTDSTDQKDSDTVSSLCAFHPSFPVPGNLLQNLPPTEKVHQIIARTALFVGEHGGQSEIVLRVKQGDNPTFGFLMPHHHLHPYFRYLVDHPEFLKSNDGGKSQDEKTNDTQASGALYLLGSVYGSGEDEDVEADRKPEQMNPGGTSAVEKPNSSQPEQRIPSGNENKKEDPDSVDLHLKVSALSKSAPNNIKSGGASNIKNNGNVSSSISPITEKSKVSSLFPLLRGETTFMDPPPEMKTSIDWIVEIVLKNGKDFEAVLIEQDKKRGSFPFLLPSNQYNPYYLSALKKAQESRISGKTSCPEKHGLLRQDKDENVAHQVKEDELASLDELDDLDLVAEKKEKFKMVIPKSKRDPQEQTSKQPQRHSGVTVDAAATAAILQAATRGIRKPNLNILSKTSQPQSLALKRESSDSISGEKEFAKLAAQATASGPYSSEAELMRQQKLKAERLRRAKMFAAMIKSGGKPLESHEPGNSGSVTEKATEEVKGSEGNCAPLEAGTSNEKGKFLGNSSNDENEVKISKNRHYRSRKPDEGERKEESEGNEEESEGADVEDERRSRKRHKSRRSSRHHRDRSKDRHKRRRKHSSSKSKEFRHRHRKCDSSSSLEDDDDDGHHRHKHDSSSSEEEHKHRKRRNRHDRSPEEDNERHKRRHKQSHTKDRHGERSRKDDKSLVEESGLEEGEIRMKSPDQSISAIASREASKSPKLEKRASLPPLESTEVPDELRAKIRAMLLATM